MIVNRLFSVLLLTQKSQCRKPRKQKNGKKWAGGPRTPLEMGNANGKYRAGNGKLGRGNRVLELGNGSRELGTEAGISRWKWEGKYTGGKPPLRLQRGLIVKALEEAFPM